MRYHLLIVPDTAVRAGKLLTSPPDLITAFHLLLCCVQFVATHAAAETKSTLTGTSGEVALAALCKQSGASLAGTPLACHDTHTHTTHARHNTTRHTTHTCA